MLLLFAAALSATPVPLGRFVTWSPMGDHAVRLASDGVTIAVDPLPCPAVPENEGCRYDHVNNQVAVTVSAPGMEPVRVISNRQSSYVRVAAVRFDRRDPRPGVVVESQSGGSGGDMTAVGVVPTAEGWRAVELVARYGRAQGQIADNPRDLSGDGVTDFVLQDARFDTVFGCNACTPRPPVVFALKDGAFVNESTDPAMRTVYGRDLAWPRARCVSDKPDRNGACAVWMADAARAGGFADAWAEMLRHYDRQATERWPVRAGAPTRTFPESLRAFLQMTGYLAG